jgi:lysophospholipase L1-like esterase
MNNIFRKLGKIVLPVLLCLGGIAVALAISEILFRSVFKKYDVKLLAAKTPAEADIINNWRDEEWAQACMRGSRKLGYEPIPNRCGRNSLGLLGDEVPIEKKDSAVRILVVGDSVTEQAYYVNYLRAMLKTINANIEVLNAGVTGYNTRQEVTYIKEKGLFLKPDLIILSFVLNDFQFTPVVFRHAGKLCYFGRTGIEVLDIIDPTLFQHSSLYRFFVWRFGMLTKQGYNYQIARKKRVEDPLRELNTMLAKKGIPLVIVLFSYPADFIEFSESEMASYQDIKALLNQYNLTHLDLGSHFTEKNTLAQIQEKIDGNSTGHPNQKGHRLASHAIYNFLVSRPDLKSILLP